MLTIIRFATAERSSFSSFMRVSLWPKRVVQRIKMPNAFPLANKGMTIMECTSAVMASSFLIKNKFFWTSRIKAPLAISSTGLYSKVS